MPTPRPGRKPEAPTSVLHLLDRTLGDRQRTTNAKELLGTASKAASRIVLSISLLLLAVTALAMTLGHLAGPGPGICSAVAIGGVGIAGARVLWKRRSSR